MIGDDEITRQDWIAARQAFAELGSRALGMDMTPVARAIAQARAEGCGEEYLVRNVATGWVYALPKLLPKFLDGQRGTRACAEWHRRQIAGPDPEDWGGFEIVRRSVGPWTVTG